MTGDADGGRRDRLTDDSSDRWMGRLMSQLLGGAVLLGRKLGDLVLVGSFDLLLPCQSDMNLQGETSLLCVLWVWSLSRTEMQSL